jgi:A/G-specific adenine glycosylase
MPTSASIRKIQTKLLAWYHKEKRDLPWRRTSDPYHILVSEVMLQQTQVVTVIPYYERWIKSFPTVAALAKAPEAKVLKHWEGLGYYSRARNLHKTAKEIHHHLADRVPDSREEILKLPGIGKYTAGAILSIAFNQDTGVLDGNVKRVLSRLFRLKENGASTTSEKLLWDLADKMPPSGKAGDFNQAIMELGALICLPKNPLCETCPLNKVCQGRGEAHLFPPPKAKVAVKKIEVSAAVILKNGKTYIQQRLHNGLMGGLWEFPGGKLEKNESPEEALVREIQEELGVHIEVGEKVLTIKHSYTKFRVTLHVFLCRLPKGRIRATSCEQWKWVAIQDLDAYPFPAANVKILEYLRATPAR